MEMLAAATIGTTRLMQFACRREMLSRVTFVGA